MDLQIQKGSRSAVLVTIILVIVAIFVVRLFYLQIIRHDYYSALADSEQLKSLIIPAKRGSIYATSGSDVSPLVLNETVYTVYADPQIIEDKNEVITQLREIAGGNTNDGFEALLDKTDTRYQVMAKKLSRTQADKLKEKNLVGIGFTEESQRVYPEQQLAAQVLGFVDGEGDGQYGVEQALNDRLEGQDGLRKTVTDVRDVPLTIGDRNVNEPAEDGEDVVLSIDANVQSYAEEALKDGVEKANATKGSAIVMDPNTGKVLAMANFPSYNPAEFNKVTDAAVFNNDIVSAPYEPASVIKTFMMATATDKGVMTPETTYYNTDSIKVEDRTIKNTYQGLTGTLTMQQVLNNSLNTGTVTLAQRLGDGRSVNRQARDTMYEYYHNRFGLGTITGIEFPNEVAGSVISPEEVEGNAVRYSNMTFGQGLNVTMIQVAAGFASVINDGVYYQPSVLAGTLDDDGQVKASQPSIIRESVVSAKTSATMRQMLHDARSSVSYMSDADTKGYTIGGKTGTAETLRNGEYVKSETVATYLGYGGTDSPEYVIMVQVSAPGKNRNLEGGLHASPIFTDISNFMIEYLHLEPKR